MKRLIKTLLTSAPLVAVSLCAGALSVRAQDQGFYQIAPKALPLPPPGEVETPPPPKPARPDERPILDQLKALVFVPSPETVNHGGVEVSDSIVLNHTDVPDETAFRSLVTPYVGNTLTRGGLHALITSIILFYRQHDRPIIDVIVPVQKITNGVIQIVILEGKVGTVSVAGNRWFSSGEIRGELPAQPGDPIRASRMQAGLDWVNQSPFHTSDLVYEPGAKLGQTDLVLQTQDRFPVRFYGGYEDSGNASTGFDRYLAGINWGDAFGLGQQINYQFTTSASWYSLQAHSGSYVVPLPWHHTLTFFGSYADTKGTIPPVIGVAGRTYQISGRYQVPLPTLTVPNTMTYKEDISGGFDYKYNKNSLLFGGVVVPGATLYDVDQFVLSYDGTETDVYGQTTLNDQAYYSPGGWGGNNNDSAFDAAHTGATSDYVYNTLVLERLTKLPENFSFVLRGTLQSSDANLAPSEQLGFGGYDTVRGYDEREVNADEGYIFTTEVRAPSLSVGQLFHWDELNDQLQFLGFWDYGSAHNHTLLPGEPVETPLSAVGLGLRFSINTNLTLRYDLGFQLIRTGFDNDHGSRSDLGIVMSY